MYQIEDEGYLPITREDMEKRGWEEVDFVYVIGDAYVDHPSFGPAVISRVLESHGYKIGMIPQPDWKKEESFQVFGKPRLGFLICGGNMDTMVNHYTVAKKKRHTDAYSPGGEMGKRPDRATIVYGNMIRKIYKEVPIIIGGIEASLRRLSHYDYWSDTVKQSILLDSQADLISYGMGERSIVEIADALNSGIAAKDITFINGTVYKTDDRDAIYDGIMLKTFDQIKADKKEFARSFQIQYENTDAITGKRLIEAYGKRLYVVQNPPSAPLSEEEMDEVYALPYQRNYHPSYEEAGGIPAIIELKFSLVSNRGCFGGCNFCALTFHQGRRIQIRSHESIIREAEILIADKDFKGYINDVGGPTANFRHTSCEKQKISGVCLKKQCLFPQPCKNLTVDHSDYLSLLKKLRELPKVKKVFIRSGIRFDYLIADKDPTFMRELCEHHVSGQLKVAPEHISDSVLKLMGKPENTVYQKFMKAYQKTNDTVGKKQFVVPYLMSSHPGSSLKEAIELAEYLRDIGYMPEQVQDFYPTPSTISTCMYYTGLDPRTMQEVYVTKDPHEKAMQRALIQFRNPKNRSLVTEALIKAERKDLIGFDKKCLIRPPYRAGQKFFEKGDGDKKYGYKKQNEKQYDHKGQSEKQYDYKKQNEKQYDHRGQNEKQYDYKKQNEKQYDHKGQSEKQYDYKKQNEKQYDHKGQSEKQYDYKGQNEKQYDYKGQSEKQYDYKGQNEKQYDHRGQNEKQYNNKKQNEKQYDHRGQNEKQYNNKKQNEKQYDNKKTSSMQNIKQNIKQNEKKTDRKRIAIRNVHKKKKA